MLNAVPAVKRGAVAEFIPDCANIQETCYPTATLLCCAFTPSLLHLNISSLIIVGLLLI